MNFAKSEKTTVVLAYGPSDNESKEIKDEFWDSFNGRVGKNEEIDTLIMLVQERQDLYDNSRSGHSNTHKVDQCWNEVAGHLPEKRVINQSL